MLRRSRKQDCLVSWPDKLFVSARRHVPLLEFEGNVELLGLELTATVGSRSNGTNTQRGGGDLGMRSIPVESHRVSAILSLFGYILLATKKFQRNISRWSTEYIRWHGGYFWYITPSGVIVMRLSPGTTPDEEEKQHWVAGHPKFLGNTGTTSSELNVSSKGTNIGTSDRQ